jgi:hypothetical protein
VVAPAAADILPGPQRPTWDEHPAPEPDPPLDPALDRLALGAALAMLLALSAAAGRRLAPRRRAPVRP